MMFSFSRCRCAVMRCRRVTAYASYADAACRPFYRCRCRQPLIISCHFSLLPLIAASCRFAAMPLVCRVRAMAQQARRSLFCAMLLLLRDAADANVYARDAGLPPPFHYFRRHFDFRHFRHATLFSSMIMPAMTRAGATDAHAARAP
jgi:hypothetical protein